MDPNDNWIEDFRGKIFKTYEFNKMSDQFQKIEILQTNFAMAKYGGPIAVGRKSRDQIILMESLYKDHIIFFTNKGQILKQVPFNDDYKKGDIIGFDFIQDELLIVIFPSGEYYMLDPFKKEKKIKNFGIQFQKEQIKQAKIFENGCVFLTEYNKFYYVMDLYDPMVRPFINIDFKELPKSWNVIPPRLTLSGKVEVHVSLPGSGVGILVEEEKVKNIFVQASQQQQTFEIRNIEMMQSSPDYEYYAYLSRQNEKWFLYIVSADLSGKTQLEIELTKDKECYLFKQLKLDNVTAPLQLMWCATDCIIIVLPQRYLQLKKVGKIKNTEIYEIKISSKGVFCSQEIDGLRIISNRRNEILRKLPEAYINIFKMFSQEPGNKLYEAYQEYELWLPLEKDDIRNKKADLIQGVKDCLTAGHFELNFEYSTKLLKAASYGKTFLNAQDLDHNKLFDVCKYLRVVYNLQQSDVVARTITYEQLKEIDEEIFIKILLRYNQHHLAFQICKNLEFQDSNKLIPMIYEHWACCKLEVDKSDELCDIIKQKLQGVRGVSFTEIAQKAIQLNNQEVALKLLDSEPSIPKRIPVLIGMAESDKSTENNYYYEKALEESLKSQDTNLIQQVILSILSSNLNLDYVFMLFRSKYVAKQHFIAYLKSFDPKTLLKFLETTKNQHDLAYYLLQRGFNIKDHMILNGRIEYYINALKILKSENNPDNTLIKLLETEIRQTEGYFSKTGAGKIKKQPSISIDEICPVKQISSLLKDDQQSDAYDIKKTEKISDKRFLIMKVKSLIKNKKYEELRQLVEKENNKKVIIPYDLIADQILEISKNEEKELAVQYLQKMENIEERVDLLMRLNQQREAAKSLIKDKKDKLLYELRQKVTDESTQHLIDQHLQQTMKK